MNAREVIVEAIYRHCGNESRAAHAKAADAVLAALRDHWTSDEEIERVWEIAEKHPGWWEGQRVSVLAVIDALLGEAKP